jgi:hypothetical protein
VGTYSLVNLKSISQVTKRISVLDILRLRNKSSYYEMSQLSNELSAGIRHWEIPKLIRMFPNAFSFNKVLVLVTLTETS